MSHDTTPPLKRCYACKEFKPLEMFHHSKSTLDGYKRECKPCTRAYQQSRSESIRERRRITRAARLERNRLPTPENKKCSKCGQQKTADQFYVAKKSFDGLQSHCKQCRKTPAILRAEQERASWPKGHKRCWQCKEIKSLENFPRNKNSADGFHAYCKICSSKRACDWAKANPERHLAQSRNWTHANPEKSRQIKCNWETNNSAKARQIRHTSYQRHRDKKAVYGRLYAQAYPHKRNAITARRRARLAGAGGRGVTGSDIQAMIYIQQGLCAYCERDGQKLTLDHVIPLYQGGIHDVDNSCMACGKCNSSKGARTPEQWIKAGRWFDL